MRKRPLDKRDAEQLRVLGEVVRTTRRGRLSLEELATRAGISAGQLSHIENGTGNPTVEMLMKIAGALDLNISDLVEREPIAPTYVVRAGERRRYHPVTTDSEVYLMTPGIRHQLAVSNRVMEPGDVRIVENRGEVLLYVLRGELEVRQSRATYRLRSDTSLLVSLPCTTEAVGATPTEFISVFRPEEGL